MRFPVRHTALLLILVPGGAATGAAQAARPVSGSPAERQLAIAEALRHVADSIVFPAYTGGPTREGIIKHVKTNVYAWVKAKRAAIEMADLAYAAVVTTQPPPLAENVIAAVGHSAQLRGRFVAEFRAAPIPAAWRANGAVPGSDLTYAEVRDEYYSQVDEAAEPQKIEAKAAFTRCVDYSIARRLFNATSRACEAWLAKHYPAEFHVVDEFLPSAVTSVAGLEQLQVRDYVTAEATYREVLRRDSVSYDAHLGLALALRGQITERNLSGQVNAASAEIDAARRIAPNRPEAWFNDAILTAEFKVKEGRSFAIMEQTLLEARALLSQFLARATKPSLANARRIATRRINEIDLIVEFNRSSAQERRVSP